MEILKEKFFNILIFIFDKLVMSDNPFSKKILSDMDKRIESRKPIEAIKDDIADIKSELIHIKNYIRKNEIRHQLIEEKYKEEKETDQKIDDSFEKVNNRSWWWN